MRTIRIGTPPIEVHIRENARAKRMTLRVTHGRDRVRMTVPLRTPLGQADSFAQSHEGWLRDRLASGPEITQVKFGVELPVLGQLRRIAPGSGRTVRLTDQDLLVPDRDDAVSRRVAAWLKVSAREHLADAVERYSALLGKTPSAISLRDTRSRWGSCTSGGRLMFSWRLMMAPYDVLNYVAAHEVAHLEEMNHSSAFWKTVADLMPDYTAHRDWLRQRGAELHRYQF